jgi:hypothetical protein
MNGTIIKKYRGTGFLTMALLCATLASLSAQPALNFKRALANWPTVELYFITMCNGSRLYTQGKSDFTIEENNRTIKDFTFWGPDSATRCSISTAVVLDCSARMDSGYFSLKNGAHAFVSFMDGANDEATIISFDSAVQVNSEMTTLKIILDDGIDAPSTGGSPKLWDGLYRGLQELIANGLNQCRAVLLFASGYDSLSTRTSKEVILLANRYRIRVFTFGYGLAVNNVLLDSIALQTGGLYSGSYPSENQIQAAYQEIAPFEVNPFYENVITYQSECTDGSTRTVKLTWNGCGGISQQTQIFHAPKDTTTYMPVPFTLDKAWSKGDTDVVIPLKIAMNLNDNLEPFSFALNFDAGCVSLKSITTPPGAYLEGNPILLTPTAAGASVSIPNRTHIADAGMLALFTFHTSDPIKDTTCCPIVFSNWQFTAGCFRPMLDTGEICIIPRAATAVGAPTSPSELSLECYPNPLRDAAIIRYTLPEAADVTLVVFDALGRQVRTLVSARQQTGKQSAQFICTDLPSGVYTCRMTTGNGSCMKQMMVLR